MIQNNNSLNMSEAIVREMRLIVMAVLLMCILISTRSLGQNLVMPLWVDDIPNFEKTSETETRDSSDIVIIRNVQEPSIAVFLPATRNATGQAVIICPGGGYQVLAYDWEGTDIAKWLNSKGIAAVVLKYRLPVSTSNIVRYNSPLLDVQRALRMTRLHANEWSVDPDQIGVMGFSAGGHLASTLGTHFDTGSVNSVDPVDRQSCRPDFMILVYPVITFTESFRHQGSMDALLGDDPNPDLVAYFSNEKQVKSDTPPTFLVHAGDDEGVPVENSLVFYEALITKSVPAEMHIYPKGGHGFALALDQGYLATWTDRCITWLENLD